MASEDIQGFDFGDDVDVATFEQILDMDEGEDGENDHEFSKSIVFGFLEQAEQTFQKMDTALDQKDLDELSNLGHFLKGSSATLGFTHIKDECEKIQHYGHKLDETGAVHEPDEAKCLRLIDQSVSLAKKAFKRVNRLMQDYYARLENQ